MKLLDHFFRRRSDPTLSWSTSRPSLPAFDVSAMRFGSLRFGDGLEAAAFLGRPDRFTWTSKEYCELLYASSGFQIDCDKTHFAYLAFLIGPDDCQPAHEELKFARPKLRGCTPHEITLSSATTRRKLEESLGNADSVDDEPDEVILSYLRHGVMMEFELDGTAERLKRCNLYPGVPD